MAYAALGSVRDEWIGLFREWARGSATYDIGPEVCAWVKKMKIQEAEAIAEDSMHLACLGPLWRLKGAMAKDLAATVQHALSTEVMEFAEGLLAKEADASSLVLTGGCALNVRLNEDLRTVEKLAVHVASAPNDGGLPLGAVWALYPPHREDARQSTAYIGPALFDLHDLARVASERQARHVSLADTAALLASGKLLALIRGRTEYGPRALGHRSLVGFAGAPELKQRMNRLKGRAWYRPVAPVVPLEQVHKFFVIEPADVPLQCISSAKGDRLTFARCQTHSTAVRRAPAGGFSSPYMSFAPPLQPWAMERFDAITHLDGTGRVQTVSADDCPWFHSLLIELEKLTGAAILANTSCNVRGEPIVNSIADVLKILDDQVGNLDAAVVENFVFERS